MEEVWNYFTKICYQDIKVKYINIMDNSKPSKPLIRKQISIYLECINRSWVIHGIKLEYMLLYRRTDKGHIKNNG